MTDTTKDSQQTSISNSNDPTTDFNPEPCSSTSGLNIADKCSASTSSVAESTTNDCNDAKMDKELLLQALQSMQHGKRHMIVNDYKSAVPCFEIACEFLGKCYGLRAFECAEAYLNYGISLYEMCRLEDGFDGGVVNVKNENSEDEEEDGDEENDNEEGEANDEQNKTEEEDDDKEAESVPIETNTDEQIKDESKMDIDLMAQQPSTSKSEASSSSNNADTNGNKPEDEEQEEPLNIEIAYEVLTTAKEIYSNHLENKNARINYAEALQKLGEISIDWENIDGAIELLNECLSHRKKVLLPDDRSIAVTYYFLGVAFSCKYDCENSTICFQKALDVIRLRIDNLKMKDLTNIDMFEKASIEAEMQQLEGLIPEIESRIEDMKEQIKSRSQTIAALENENQEEEQKSKELKKDKPITNVSHLIKRKREDNENGETSINNEESLKKKLCSSNNSNTNVSSSTSDNSTNNQSNDD